MRTVNEETRDAILKHNHYVYRYENGTMNNIVDHYNRTKYRIIASIKNLEDYGQGYTLQYRLDRLHNELRQIDQIMKDATDGAVNELSYELNQFALSENDYYFNLLNGKFNAININLATLPVDQINQIVNTPLGGASYSDRMYKHYGDMVFRVRNELTQSIILGEDMSKASRRLLGMGKNLSHVSILGNEIQKQAKAIARTEIQRVSNSVSHAIYDNNQDILKGEEFCATLDDRTCLVCASDDGKIFYFNKNPIGAGDRPPRHPFCRCCLVPLTYSWKELGINAEEVPGGTRPYVITDKTKKRFSGQAPESMKYNDWLKHMNKKDPAFVKDILGPKRYELWSSGELTLKKMVSNNKVIKLSDLKIQK